MTPVRDALAVLMPAFRPLGVERVSLDRAAGRYLAQALAVRVDLPPFDNSAMDGYAVRAAEVSHASAAQPVALPVVGESRAGDAPGAVLTPGTARRIFTGAPLPVGADAVVPQEAVVARGDAAHFERPTPAEKHVRRRGSDVASGQPLLEAGSRLGPGEVALLASQGHAFVTVHRAPRVAVLSTGDELVDVEHALQPGAVVNSNAHMLAALVREAGGVPVVLPQVGDTLEATVEALRQALTCDVVVTSGGVSVGDHDVVKDALQAAGVAARFWKVAMKPGKPLTFGLKGQTPVVGLPGNPVSAFVTFEVFVRPGLRAMLGDPRPHRALCQARLAEDVRHETGRLELCRATAWWADDGALMARPLPNQGSGSLPSLAGCEALLGLASDVASFPAGSLVPAVLLHGGPGSHRPPFS